MSIRCPKKHDVENQRNTTGQWMEDVSIPTVNGFISIETSARQTTEVEELGSIFNGNELRAKLPKCKTY